MRASHADETIEDCEIERFAERDLDGCAGRRDDAGDGQALGVDRRPVVPVERDTLERERDGHDLRNGNEPFVPIHRDHLLPNSRTCLEHRKYAGICNKHLLAGAILGLYSDSYALQSGQNRGQMAEKMGQG